MTKEIYSHEHLNQTLLGEGAPNAVKTIARQIIGSKESDHPTADIRRNVNQRLNAIPEVKAVQVFFDTHHGGYVVCNDAPTNLAELRQRTPNSYGTIFVDAGFSENTIFGYSRVNHQFRAWHDRLHLFYNLDTTVEGEWVLAPYHILSIDNLADFYTDKVWASGSSLDWLRSVVWAETHGQNEYFKKYGEFIDWQADFSLHAIAYGLEAALSRKF